MKNVSFTFFLSSVKYCRLTSGTSGAIYNWCHPFLQHHLGIASTPGKAKNRNPKSRQKQILIHHQQTLKFFFGELELFVFVCVRFDFNCGETRDVQKLGSYSVGGLVLRHFLSMASLIQWCWKSLLGDVRSKVSGEKCQGEFSRLRMTDCWHTDVQCALLI